MSTHDVFNPDLPGAEFDDPDVYLTGKLLVSMPGMPDDRFDKTVIYICSHGPEGAMGLVVNRVHDSFTFSDMLAQLSIPIRSSADSIKVHFGGPVDEGRGFVLHSSEYLKESSLVVDNHVALTATLDILRDMASGSGPEQSVLALGYAGWSPGQLDTEIQANGWLVVDPDDDLLYGEDQDDKWMRAMGKLGIDPMLLSDAAGHA